MRILLFILLLLPASLFGTDYYVKTGGNDGAAGTSDGTAWATIDKVNSTVTAGSHTVYFNRGDEWKEKLYPVAGVTYTAYGTGAKPIITARDEVTGWDVSGNWTNTSGNIWRMSYSGTARRLWIDGTEVKWQWYLSDVTSDYPWRLTSDYLYIYSATNPATAFSLIEISIGRSHALNISSEDNVTISYLDLRGSGSTILLRNSDNFIADSCLIGRDCDGYGIEVWQSSTSERSDNAEIKNCVFDTGYTLYCEWRYSGASEDGIHIGSNTDDWDIHDSYFKNWGHSGIYILNVSTDYSNNNILIYDNYITSPDISYGRAFCVDYIEGSGCKMYNNTMYDVPTVSQLNGEYFEFFNNVMNIVAGSPWETDDFPEYHPGAGLGIQGYATGTTPNHIKVYNNVIANTKHAGLTMHQWDDPEDPDMAVYDNEIVNNIFYNCDDWHDYAVLIGTGDSVLNNIWRNNIFYKSGVTDVIYYGNDGGEDYPHTVAEFNAENGTADDVISGNMGGDPLFTNAAGGDFALAEGSPAIDAGIYIGIPFEGTAPDIGAFEFEDPPEIPTEVTFLKSGTKFIKSGNKFIRR